MSTPTMTEKTFDGFPINNMDPFASPAPSMHSRGVSGVSGVTSRRDSSFPRKGRMFKSQRVNTDELKSRTPWYETPVGRGTLRRTRWTCLGVSSIGILAAAAMIVTTFLNSPNEKYCLVLEDNFETLNTDTWFHEVELGGFGNGEFEMTTTSSNNSFVEDGKLYIVPTFTADNIGYDNLLNGYVMNLTADGTCTSTTDSNCATFSNSTYGNVSTIPPIMSARLTTKFSHSIKYGRVEVKARMPTGNWIWPAIWMLPTENVYGDWPRSGEIDIVETKGNMPTTNSEAASNVVKTALHWGLSYASDMYTKTRGEFRMKQTYTNQQFTTYGMDWSPQGIDIWTSLRSKVSLSVKFNKSFWNRGNFAGQTYNGTSAVNPWTGSANPHIAPFDIENYLILSVAVGGTNGWFNDSPDVPWSMNSPTAARDFWEARELWQDTWPTDPRERGMAIESVKIWRLAEKGETCAA